MALITSAASGNFNAGATWTGGVVPTTGDEARASNGHSVTINVNTTCDEISNIGTGKFVLNSGVTLTANVTQKSNSMTVACLEFNSASPEVAYVTGNVTPVSGYGYGINLLNSGTINITGNCFVTTAGSGAVANAVRNSSTSGTINITGNCTAGSGGSNASAVINNSTGRINITGNCNAANVYAAAVQNSTGILSVIGTVTASASSAGVAGTNVQQVTILSGPFITETSRGVNPVYCAAWRWNASPSNSTYMEVMTNNLLAKRNLVTADNITGMPAASDVKSGIAYGPSSELTGTFSQTVTPSTADIATAVWSAASRTITEGGITAADVWSAASRTITGGTVTTLTNAPSVPSASAIASQVRTELTTELNRLDTNVGSRAASGTLASDVTAIKAKTDAINVDRINNTATLSQVGNLLAQANS